MVVILLGENCSILQIVLLAENCCNKKEFELNAYVWNEIYGKEGRICTGIVGMKTSK